MEILYVKEKLEMLKFMSIRGFSVSKQLKKFAFSTASWLKKIKEIYRLKVFSDKTFDS
jgi:hypothetical protein